MKASTIQSGVSVSGDKITGTLNYLDESNAPGIVSVWGNGYFLFLNFADHDENATSLKVGMTPSEGSGLIEAINDTDQNGTFKVTDKNKQKVTFITSDGTNSTAQYFDLKGLTLASA